MTRTERQNECISNWKKTGKATIVACTGFGKTRIALNILDRLKKLNPVINVVVPTTYLKSQWEEKFEEWNIDGEVSVINTAITQTRKCNILILDEIHRFAATEFSRIFDMYSYEYVLGLTATYERADDKHELLNKYAPVCDNVSLSEASANGWVASFRSYDVMLKVNLQPYKVLNRKFHKFFSFFGHDFKLAMSLLKDKGAQKAYAYKMGWSEKEVATHVINFIRFMQKRKSWIHNHPKKLKVAQEIIAARADKKIITFSNFTEQADAVEYGVSYHSANTSKQNKEAMAAFLSGEVSVINTGSKLNEGADIPGLGVGIVISGDSSKTKFTQRLGRVIRKEGNKEAEFFTLLIEGTQDERWNKSRNKSNVTVIDYEELRNILKS